MNSSEFDIIFRGDIVFGHQLVDVKLKLQQLFKVDAAKVDTLFTGRPVPLKRNLDEATAQKYRDVLLKAGALVEISASNKNPPVASEPVMAATQWTLAPVGADLLPGNAQQKPLRRAINTLHLSLRPATGYLLDFNEMNQSAVAAVVAPSLELAGVGANMVNPDEKFTLPQVEIFVDDWEIAEVGSDLLSAGERSQVVPVVVDVSQLTLAPVGSDLAQLKPDIKPVAPDISKITLAP